MTKRQWVMIGLVTAAVVTVSLVLSSTAFAGKLEDAIASTPKGAQPGMINPEAPKGFLGIPGAPNPMWFWGILWGIWVGWIFSSVGAFGGVMAGVGHISVFGLGDYASTFKKTSPVLNKLLTDSIKTSNQYLVGLSALISSVTYYRMGRLVLPLALFLGGGSIIGSWTAANFSSGKLGAAAYTGIFGLLVLVIGGFLIYETTERGQSGKKAAKAAAAAFEKQNMRAGATGGVGAQGVRFSRFEHGRIYFTFYGVEFSFNPIWPFIGGLIIAAISALIGVGGGFLYVPFLTSIAGLPMYIVAGTSALAVLISMITSITTYMLKGVPVDLGFVGLEMVGIFIGSILGPLTSKKIPEIWLKRIFIVLALYVGLGYVMKGFFPHVFRLPGL